MSKYRPLSDRLSGHADDEWRTNFADIEQLLGFSLPKGARSGRAWWERAAPDGWEVGDVSQSSATVTFRRKPASAPAAPDPVKPAAMVAASEKASGLAARHRKLGAAAIAAGVAATGVGVGMAIMRLTARPTLLERARKRFR